ncbi:hypothetical protein PybrP1_006170 [[Pythium] brassicae (nom. inval.)]|nr:hypothetical protein PybrP1_006170 [[Pythium] brassicae (nom. inval.)]
MRQEQSALVLRKVLHLLWKCERTLLVEYIESAIPVVYAVSMCALYLLPNARYYPETAEMSSEQMCAALTSILVYASLELASLACMHGILQSKLRFSALHQLAFVFENERLLLQGVFMAWVIIILQFTLVHFGVDFTFEFKWIRHAY